MRIESSKHPNMPILPVFFKTYPGLIFNQGYIHSVENEVSIGTAEMTDDLFLALCAISSPEDAEKHLKEYPCQRFFSDINRLIPPREYYEHVFTLVDCVKSAYGLWKLQLDDNCKAEEVFIDDVAAYIENHKSLSVILNSYIIETAVNYRSNDFGDQAFYDSFFNTLTGIRRETSKFIHDLEYKYLLLDPCNTIFDAMWKFGYQRIFINLVEYRQCQKAGCKECFSVGPGGQIGRKYCHNHLK